MLATDGRNVGGEVPRNDAAKRTLAMLATLALTLSNSRVPLNELTP